MNPDERSSVSNGIWLCQNCAKLIDNDVARYPPDLLRDWKRRAEQRTRAELEKPVATADNGPTLHVPAASSASWLSYVSGSTTFRGRTGELSKLRSFLRSEARFQWWIVTGSAGSGKSRLAFELCKEIQADWQAGFLSRADTFNGWSRWQPTRPTLIVADYVAGRSAEISDITLQLARAAEGLPQPVRLLLVERELSSSWWSEFQREASYSEAIDIAGSQYALPIRIAGMSDHELESLVSDIGEYSGATLSETERTAILAHARRIDSAARPLFAMIAAIAQMSGASHDSWQEMLRPVLVRERARWKSMFPDAEPRGRAENLLVLATILGGFSLFSEGVGEALANSNAAALLPDPHFLDLQSYLGMAGGPADASELPGLQPDLIGEFFVLERLKGTSSAQASAKKLLETAWDRDPEAASQFVRRAVADFPADPATSLLQEAVARTAEQRKAWSRLAGDLVTFQPNSRDPQGVRNLRALREMVDAHPSEVDLQANRARAEFNLGCLLMQESNYEGADGQFSLAIGLRGATSETIAGSLNNRGIARLYLLSREDVLADYSAVLSTPDASDEVKACALNNRADMFQDDGNLERAIEDRSSVLQLRETSYNRRYIAHIRRSAAYLRLGRTSDALADIAAILDTEDTIAEQKMQAHLQRGRILSGEGQLEDAMSDVDRVLQSPVNFDGTVPEAFALRGSLNFQKGNDDASLEDFRAVLTQEDADGSLIAEAFLGCGRISAHRNQAGEARELLIGARDHPSASAYVKREAEHLLASLR